jgi:hypothetical protein
VVACLGARMLRNPLDLRPLASNAEFDVDRSRERFLLTYNPSGYLRRVAPVPRLVGAPVEPELEAQPPATAAVTPASASAA